MAKCERAMCLLADKLSTSKNLCRFKLRWIFWAGGKMKTIAEHVPHPIVRHNDLCRLAHDSLSSPKTEKKNDNSRFGCVYRALIPFSVNARKQPNKQ